ncbi:hypothetical protein [Brevibacillus sp. SIMBA_040]
METFIAVSAFYLNPILAIWFFVNLTTIIKKIVKGEDYESKLWIGSLLIAWIVF